MKKAFKAPEMSVNIFLSAECEFFYIMKKIRGSALRTPN